MSPKQPKTPKRTKSKKVTAVLNVNGRRLMDPEEELREIAQRLRALELSFDDTIYRKPLDAIRESAEEVSRAWSGSWLGFESRIYYQGFATPPPGRTLVRDLADSTA